MESAAKCLFHMVFLVTLYVLKRKTLTMKEIVQRQGIILTHACVFAHIYKQNDLYLLLSCIRNTCNHLVFLIFLHLISYMLSLTCIGESFSISFPLLSFHSTSCCLE